jgi:hypothetical protein
MKNKQSGFVFSILRPRNLSRTLRRQPAYFIELFPLNLVGRIQAWVAG